MSATLAWRSAVTAEQQEERERILAEASSPDSVEEALGEAAKRLDREAEEALAYADIAYEMAKRVGSPKLLSAAARTRGRTLRALSRHLEAVDALEAAARYALEAGDELMALQSRIGIVDSLGWLERFDEAIQLAQNLQDRLLVRGQMSEAAKVLVNLGNVLHRRDDYQGALDAFDRAIEMLKGSDEVTIAQVSVNKANALTHLNRVHEAAEIYEWASKVFAAQDDIRSSAVVDLNLGFLRYISGEHSAAIKAFTRSRRAFERLGRTVEAAKVDLDMGDAYRALNLLPEALECYEGAIRVFESVPLEYEIGRAEVGRAVVLASYERYEDALAALSRAEGIFAHQKNRLQLAHAGLIRAHVLRAAGEDERAARQASEAARALSEAGLHGWAAEAAFVAHDVALGQGRDATKGMEEVARVAHEHLRSSLESRAHHSLGRYYQARGDTDKALEHFRLAVSALEHARTLVSIEAFHVAFLRDKISVYDDLVSTLLTRGLKGDYAEALEYLERSKSRLLLERFQRAHDEALRSSGSIDPELAARIAHLRAQICEHYHGLHAFDGMESIRRRIGATLGDIAELRVLESQYEEALREAELVAPEVAASSRPLGHVPKVEELQSALAPDEVLVEYACFQGQVAAFVLTSTDLTALLHVTTVASVEQVARRLRFNLQRVEGDPSYVERHRQDLHQAMQRALEDLHKLLIAPIERYLRGSKVVFVPHGPIHGLPLHAAYDGERFALDRWEIVYSPGAAIWYSGVIRQKSADGASADELVGQKALLMGVPAPGIELVYREVHELSDILRNATVFYGPEATLEAFRQHAPESRIIHLATHALFRADNPLFSGLRFADEWLMAQDLYAYRLNCELATLSACRTAATLVEPGDELFGLTRGFLAAGARSLAVSLWPAADEATMKTMVSFYRNLASGMSRAGALRAAQIATREAYTHPYYWAAFVLVGAR